MIRSSPEDFQVDELPAYEPEGTGEHLFVQIEKRGMASGEMLSRVARTLQLHPRDIGIAGQKDRHAVTRQHISVPRQAEARLTLLEDCGLRILSVTAHRNKLRTGHLQGNQFTLTLRRDGMNWIDSEVDAIRQRLQVLQQEGFPNFFGPQRFGRSGSTVRDGLLLLHGQLSKRHWPYHQQRMMTRLALSAVQSAVFNLVVAQRIRSGTVSVPVSGDVVIRQHGSRPFLMPVTPLSAVSELSDPLDAGDIDVRCAPGRVSNHPAVGSRRLLPAGPMFGPKMLASEGEAHETEQQALARLDLTGPEFARFARLCSGARRVMLEFPEDIEVIGIRDASHSGITAVQLRFSLRAGCYATVLLREICPEIRDAGPAADDAMEDPDALDGSSRT